MDYNKALDYTALGLNATRKGKFALAAKLFAKAAQQDDCITAIRILEASNADAAERAKIVSSKRKIKAADEEFGDEDPLDEVDADIESLDDEDDDGDDGSIEAELEDEDEMDDEEDGAEAMAKVLASMRRTTQRAPVKKR